ncbi:phytoene desaturase family protein [Leifsonia shinshuensis]|uniref:NAD(P)/FAD-dependent oxidoreductase n=1 Tax=Leifsonia shinshuensis TaxID=150026 RepID=A0A7G6Y855_9MICO|nr:NAD(P)/FAD-dependent oxidoreductase [Leifsonia shinshuensis]QNE34670.1 NAD(P)/FAD-dependent oxidoreductase [Leifsonia shinshuensis]
MRATVVGGGPNGLSAAVTLARAGVEVTVFERASRVGGGARTSELTLPGFLHDVCSAVHPTALASPFFRSFGLTEKVPFVIPEASYAHPFADRPAAIAYRDLDRTAASLGADSPRWRSLFEPLVRDIEGVVDFTGGALLRLPARPVTAARFGMRVLESLAGARLRTTEARALFAGVAAHAAGRLPGFATAGAGMLLAAHGHAGGWGLPLGGSERIVDALVADLVAHGGTIVTDTEVTDLGDLPPSELTFLDTSARAMLRILGDRVPSRYRRAVGRFRYGAAAAKLDLALEGPIPWSDPALAGVATLHLGGTAAEIARSENEMARGRHPESPYVLLVQPTAVDPSRAPAGRHVAWAYCHVPPGSPRDMTEPILSRIEAFAPGVRDRILGARSTPATALEQYNPNYIGGDFNAGASTALQFVKRPVISRAPWRTPVPGVYLCSSSTPPGTSTHGMCGYHAARTALHDRGVA